MMSLLRDSTWRSRNRKFHARVHGSRQQVRLRNDLRGRCGKGDLLATIGYAPKTSENIEWDKTSENDLWRFIHYCRMVGTVPEGGSRAPSSPVALDQNSVSDVKLQNAERDVASQPSSSMGAEAAIEFDATHNKQNLDQDIEDIDGKGSLADTVNQLDGGIACPYSRKDADLKTAPCFPSGDSVAQDPTAIHDSDVSRNQSNEESFSGK